MKYIKNKAFARGGHECELTSIRDELPMYRQGGNICQQINNSFRRSIMVAETNVYSLRYLRSQRNIESERIRHLAFKHMVHPFSDTRKRWDAFMVFIFSSALWTIPFDIACCNFPLVNCTPHQDIWRVWRTFLDCIMLIDIIMSFCTGYWDAKRHKVVMEPKTVAIRYFCSHFIPDLISSIPKNLIFIPGEKGKYVYMVIQNIAVAKFIKLPTLRRYWRQTCEVYNIDFIKYRLISALYFYILFFHVLSCTSLVLVGLQTNNKKTVPRGIGNRVVYIWIDGKDEYDFYSAYARVFRGSVYLATFCYSAKTMANYIPGLIYVAVWIVAKIITIYLIGELMECVICTRSSTRKYVEMVRELQEYMRYKQLPVHLQNRLLKYYEFKYQKSYFNEAEILNVISDQLKQELLMHSCRKLVEHVGFFQNLPLPLLLRIVSTLTTEVYMLNDVIVKVGTPGVCMYFIVNGCVAIYTKTGYEVRHLEDGEYFGEYSLLKRSVRECSVVAVECCELYRLDGSVFVKVIMSYPDLIDKITKHALERIEMTDYIEKRFQRRRIDKKKFRAT